MKTAEKLALGLLLYLISLTGCQPKLSYTPPPPITTLSAKQKLSPTGVAEDFFQKALQQGNYRALLDYGSRRLLLEGPDKEHFLEAIERYPLRRGKVLRAKETVRGNKAKVTLTLVVGKKERILTVTLFRELHRWRVDHLTPPLPYRSYKEF